MTSRDGTSDLAFLPVLVRYCSLKNLCYLSKLSPSGVFVSKELFLFRNGKFKDLPRPWLYTAVDWHSLRGPGHQLCIERHSYSSGQCRGPVRALLRGTKPSPVPTLRKSSIGEDEEVLRERGVISNIQVDFV